MASLLSRLCQDSKSLFVRGPASPDIHVRSKYAVKSEYSGCSGTLLLSLSMLTEYMILAQMRKLS